MMHIYIISPRYFQPYRKIFSIILVTLIKAAKEQIAIPIQNIENQVAVEVLIKKPATFMVQNNKLIQIA